MKFEAKHTFFKNTIKNLTGISPKTSDAILKALTLGQNCSAQ